MWWYGYGWWWWWIGFVILFFLLPLGYGWGYRGWGPWYRRRPRGRRQPPPGGLDEPGPEAGGWGWLAAALWIVFLLAIAWFFVAWGWGWHSNAAYGAGGPY